MKITVTINSKQESWEIQPEETLLDVLRRYGYKSAKKGCETGSCGSCAIQMDGQLVNSCMVLAARANGRTLLTTEGLGTQTNPHPIHEAFVETSTVQCGYCIPGSVMAVKTLLDRTLDPDDAEIKEALDGNLCRCTGYVKRIEAVRKAADKMKRGNGQ